MDVIESNRIIKIAVMGNTYMDTEFEPFGAEWQAEMLKWSKKLLIGKIRDLLSQTTLIAEQAKEIERLKGLLSVRETNIEILIEQLMLNGIKPII